MRNSKFLIVDDKFLMCNGTFPMSNDKFLIVEDKFLMIDRALRESEGLLHRK